MKDEEDLVIGNESLIKGTHKLEVNTEERSTAVTQSAIRLSAVGKANRSVIIRGLVNCCGCAFL